jgi:ketosteroid isomerase-like protein
VEERALTLEAFRREGIDMSGLDPDVTYEDASLPDHIGETYRGHDGVVRAWECAIEPWEWLVVELEQVVDAGDRTVSIHRFRAKARHAGIELETPLAYVWTFRDGKIIHFRAFLSEHEALEAAGLEG